MRWRRSGVSQAPECVGMRRILETSDFPRRGPGIDRPAAGAAGRGAGTARVDVDQWREPWWGKTGRYFAAIPKAMMPTVTRKSVIEISLKLGK